METLKCDRQIKDRWFLFLPYLWGMETNVLHTQTRKDKKFLPYLWGMETNWITNNNLISNLVLTVPMRNGNDQKHPRSEFQPFGSYRTYEEWKQIVTNTIIIKSHLFLPYLWGMETSQAFHTVLCPSSVLTVPMRNGNQIWLTWVKIWIMFLPYLWGMETYGKQCKNLRRRYGSYRTYEEWKLPGVERKLKITTKFLPYLWGMETHIETWHSWWYVRVLTVPMRNGNERMKGIGGSDVAAFLPYLWGMETIWK